MVGLGMALVWVEGMQKGEEFWVRRKAKMDPDKWGREWEERQPAALFQPIWVDGIADKRGRQMASGERGGMALTDLLLLSSGAANLATILRCNCADNRHTAMQPLKGDFGMGLALAKAKWH